MTSLDFDVKLASETISALFNETDDPSVRLVLSKYSVSADNACNHKSFKKLSVEQLKKTAQFLNYGKSLILLKDPMIDWLLNRICELLPSKCAICNKMYATGLLEDPQIKCVTCGQGAHMPCFVDKPESQLALASTPGMHWSCTFCNPGKTKRPLTPVSPDLGTESEGHNLDMSRETNLVVTLPPLENPKTINIPQSNATNAPICIHYRQNKCKHGIGGQGCTYRHPKPCRRYMSHGTDAALGCHLGNKCDKFHPLMCRDSLLTRACYTPNCRFVHCKGTKRKMDTSSQIMTTQLNPSYNMVNMSDSAVTPHLPSGNSTNLYKQHPRPQQSTNQDMERSFLGVLNSIQLQLRKMETVQQQQALQIQQVFDKSPRQNQPIQNQAGTEMNPPMLYPGPNPNHYQTIQSGQQLGYNPVTYNPECHQLLIPNQMNGSHQMA